jgi:hypothetical protein
MLDVDLQDLTITLLGFGLALVSFFLSVSPFLPFRMGILLCDNVSWEYVTCFLTFTEAITKSLPRVSEEPLDMDY